MSCANFGWERPDISSSRRCGMRLHNNNATAPAPLASRSRLLLECLDASRTEAPRPRPAHLCPGSQHAEWANGGASPMVPRSQWLSDTVARRPTVVSVRTQFGPISLPSPTTHRPRRITPGSSGKRRGQLHFGVDHRCAQGPTWSPRDASSVH